MISSACTPAIRDAGPPIRDAFSRTSLRALPQVTWGRLRHRGRDRARGLEEVDHRVRPTLPLAGRLCRHPHSGQLACRAAGTRMSFLRSLRRGRQRGNCWTREAAAAEVALVYANDGEPGIRRRRAGQGFYLPLARRRRGPRARDSRPHRRLVIPPAWSEVWIAPSEDIHLQVTGKDIRGRKQYRYHERWTACRDEVKYASLVEFARALPRLRRDDRADLGRRGLGAEQVVATVVRLLDTTMIRVGNAAYARENAQLRADHVARPARQHRGLDAAVPLQGQVRKGVAPQGHRPADRPDRQGRAGSAGAASVPVPRRGGRPARG